MLLSRKGWRNIYLTFSSLTFVPLSSIGRVDKMVSEVKLGILNIRVSDRHFFADPDPGKIFHADPDPDPGGIRGRGKNENFNFSLYPQKKMPIRNPDIQDP